MGLSLGLGLTSAGLSGSVRLSVVGRGIYLDELLLLASQHPQPHLFIQCLRKMPPKGRSLLQRCSKPFSARQPIPPLNQARLRSQVNQK